MKICSKCQAEKEESEFRVRLNKKRTGTYSMARCKTCEYNSYSHLGKKWQKDNAKRKGEINKRYVLRNHDRIKSDARVKANNKYNCNPVKYREISKKWRIDNAEKRRAIDAKPVNELHDSYVAKVLRFKGFTDSQIYNNPEIIESQKLIIKINRHVKKETDH